MALTKVAGDILDPGISIAGVVTATAFDGPFRGGSGSDITAGVGTFTQLDVNGPGDFSGIVTFSHTQDSTSASTGTIQVAGGVGIAKSVYIGGDLVVNGNTTTIDTTLKAVDRIEVSDASTNVAVAITQAGAGDILNLFDGTTEVVTVLDGGNVGIGSATPTQKLDVAGAINLWGSDGKDYSTIINPVSGGGLRETLITKANGDLRIQAGGGVYQASRANILLKNTGNTVLINSGNTSSVGIGTSNPTNTVTFGGTQGVGARWHNYTSGNSAYHTLEAGDKFQSNVGGSGEHTWISAGATKMTLTNTGALGIGTGDNGLNAKSLESRNTGLSTPTLTWGGGNPGQIFRNEGSELKFGLTAYSPYAYFIQANTSSSTHRQLALNPMGGSVAIGVTDPPTLSGLVARFDSTHAPSLTWNAAGGHILRCEGSELNLGLWNASPHHFFIQGRTSGSAARSILLNPIGGNVGINTSSPTEKLHIEGQIRLNDATTLRGVLLGNDGNLELIRPDSQAGYIDFKSTTGEDFDARIQCEGNGFTFDTGGNGSTSEKMRIQSNGRVGIGTVSPADDPLTLYDGDNNVGMYFQCTASGNANNNGFRIGRNNSHCFIWNYENAEIALATQGTERLTINHGGYGSPAITVKTGEIATPQDYPTIRPTIDFNFGKVKKLDSRIEYSRTGCASYVDEFGYIKKVGANVPRFDHDPLTGECKGLLLEVARTNYLQWSEDLSNGGGMFGPTEWGAGSGAYTLDPDIVAPDGTTGTVYHHTGSEWYATFDASGASTNTMTYSLFVKARSGESGTVDIQCFQQVSGSVIDLSAVGINPINGTIQTGNSNSSNHKMEEFKNGWYRASWTMTTASGNFSSSTRYDIQGAEHYTWGMQAEPGNFVTSYIPTHGENENGVQRGASSAKIDGTEFSDFYRQTEGTLFVDGYVPPVSLVASAATKNGVTFTGSSQARHSIRYVSHASSATDRYVDAFQLLANGTNVVDHGGSSGNAIQNNYYKHISAFKENDYAYTYGGASQVWTDTSGDLPEMDTLTIGENATQFFLRRLVYFPKRLPNSQLTTLVS